jgi:hypothetical protein
MNKPNKEVGYGEVQISRFGDLADGRGERRAKSG